MDGTGLMNYVLWKLLNFAKEFILLYLCILAGEWFAEKRGYHLLERTWLVTMIAFFILSFIFWASLGRVFLSL